MPKKKLTHQFIEAHGAPDKRLTYYDETEKGLQLRITKTGTKTFTYRYHVNGKQRRIKIGTFPEKSLKQARKDVTDIKAQVDKGIDPQAEIQHRKNNRPETFKELADKFKDRHLSTLRESTQRTYGNRIDSEMIPAFGKMYVKDISRGVIIELLEDIAFDRNQPTHSNRVRAILSSMFTFAVQRELAEFNPVKGVPKLGDENERDRVFDEGEIKGFWNGFNQLQNPVGPALQMLLLLGQRKGETCRMKWKDIEYDKPYKRTYIDSEGNEVKEAFLVDVWTIHIIENKGKRKHEVPLPPLAVQIIESQANDSPYVFQSNRYKGDHVKSLHDAFKRVAKQADIEDTRIHDLRRTAATHMAELGTDRTVLGKVLNHKGLAGDFQVTARYDRYGYMDEKRMALSRWASKLQQIISGEETKITKIG